MIAIVTALIIVVLLGFVALGVDVSFWLWQGHREQEAADQAAMAAAVYLPDDPAGAIAQARQTAGSMGFPASTVTATIGTGSKANQIHVLIRAKHSSFISKAIGRKGQFVNRSSTAEWVPPIQMGSPFPLAGNDPEGPPGSQLNYWLSQFGPWARKHDGDRYAADNCVSDNSVNYPVPYNCTSGAAARGNSPLDYTRIGQYGYRYRVDVDTIVPGRDLAIEAFDPVLANVGNLCNINMPAAGTLWSLTSWVADATTRYVSGVGPWCVPDYYNQSGDAARDTQATETKFSVFSPVRAVTSGTTTNPVTPPAGPPAVASPPTTTIGPLGGGSLGGSCTASGLLPGTVTIRNTRATAIRVYKLNASCTEILATTIAAGASATVTGVYGGQRLRIYDNVWGGLLTDYTSSGTALIGPNDSFAVHLTVPPTCPTPTASPSTITLTNTTPGTTYDVYEVATDCRETYLGTVPAPILLLPGSKSFPLKVGSRIRVYQNSVETVMLDTTLAGAGSNIMIGGTGPGTPCSAVSSTPASINLVNNLDVPVQGFWVDDGCRVVPIGGPVAAGSSGGYSTYVGHVMQFVNTKTGAILNSTTVAAGSQTVTLNGQLVVGGACSPAPVTPMALTVVNNRATAVRVAEVNDSCVETTRGTVASGASATYSTYEGWRWRFYDAGTGDVLGDEPADPAAATVTLNAPAVAAWTGQTTGPPTCQRTETSYRLTPYNPADFHTGTIAQLINPRDGVHDNGLGTRDEFAESFLTGFRQWKRICTVSAADIIAGNYTITVRSNINDESAGMNSYSLRARWVDPAGIAAPIETGLTVSAIENLPVFVNLGGAATSQLYMTRLHPVYAGRRLRLELFDIGDVASGDVNLRIIPPPDSNVGANWPCEVYQVTNSSTITNPPGTNAATCTLTGLTRTVYNGTSVRFVVPVPANFTCTPTVMTNCWVKIEMTFNGGQPTDKTTWSATIEGDPLRLVK